MTIPPGTAKGTNWMRQLRTSLDLIFRHAERQLKSFVQPALMKLSWSAGTQALAANSLESTQGSD